MTTRLPFVSEHDYWCLPPVPSDFRTANAIGRSYGEVFLEELNDTQFPPLLGHVMRSMVNKGRFGPVEIGFCQVLATAILQKCPRGPTPPATSSAPAEAQPPSG